VLCAQVRPLAPLTRVVLSYPPSEHERAAARAAEYGADGFLVGPPKRHAVLAQLHAVMKQRALLETLRLQANELERAKAKARPAPRAATGLNTADDAFFRKYMLLEVKRSKRYKYPLALMLVSLDTNADVPTSSEFQRAAVRAEVLQSLSALMRDIDLLMPFAVDKFLVLLPHTPRGGSQTVARRVVARLRKLESFKGGTASVGLASYDPKLDPKAQISFGGMVREATEALKRAQEAGGDRVVTNAPEEPLQPKKNRISMG
jgi:PleD family two-component response regulator